MSGEQGQTLELEAVAGAYAHGIRMAGLQLEAVLVSAAEAAYAASDNLGAAGASGHSGLERVEARRVDLERGGILVHGLEQRARGSVFGGLLWPILEGGACELGHLEQLATLQDEGWSWEALDSALMATAAGIADDGAEAGALLLGWLYPDSRALEYLPLSDARELARIVARVIVRELVRLCWLVDGAAELDSTLDGAGLHILQERRHDGRRLWSFTHSGRLSTVYLAMPVDPATANTPGELEALEWLEEYGGAAGLREVQFFGEHSGISWERGDGSRAIAVVGSSDQLFLLVEHADWGW